MVSRRIFSPDSAQRDAACEPPTRVSNLVEGWVLGAGGHQRPRPVPQPSSDSCSRLFGTAQILFVELSIVLYVSP